MYTHMTGHCNQNPLQDTMESVIDSLKAQVRSLQHELCVVKDDSDVRIQEVQKKVEELEKENARLRMQPPQ